jgi:hypothetical protein
MFGSTEPRKKTARDERAVVRERPHELFGWLKAEKVGSLPPDLVFFSNAPFLFYTSCIVTPANELLAPQGEEAGEGWDAERILYRLHGLVPRRVPEASKWVAGTSLRHDRFRTPVCE